MGRGDKDSIVALTCKYDIARLVTYIQRSSDLRRSIAQIDNADRVREMVHHPDFVVGPRRNCYRLQANHNVARMTRSLVCQVENLDAVVGCIGNKQAVAGRRHGQRVELVTLEVLITATVCSNGIQQHREYKSHTGDLANSTCHLVILTEQHQKNASH